MRGIILASILLIVVLAIFVSPVTHLPKSALRAWQFAVLAILSMALAALRFFEALPHTSSIKPLVRCELTPYAVCEMADVICVRLC